MNHFNTAVFAAVVALASPAAAGGPPPAITPDEALVMGVEPEIELPSFCDERGPWYCGEPLYLKLPTDTWTLLGAPKMGVPYVPASFAVASAAARSVSVSSAGSTGVPSVGGSGGGSRHEGGVYLYQHTSLLQLVHNEWHWHGCLLCPDRPVPPDEPDVTPAPIPVPATMPLLVCALILLRRFSK